MSHSVPTEKTNVPSSSALWAVLIFIGLILAAINFVKAESGSEAHGEHGEAKTEQVDNEAHKGKEAAGTPGEAAEAAAKPAEGATTGSSATPASTDTTKAAATEEAHH